MTDPFDDLARRAGASLRSEAPADGPADALRAGRRQQRLRVGGAVGAVALLAVGGIVLATRDDSSSTVTADTIAAVPSTTAAPTTLAVTTTAAVSTTAAIDQPTQWALDFVGSSGGSASGAPVRIGLALGSTDDLSEPFTDAAAEWVNSELGGIQGRPIELVACDGVADPTGCADQFANDAAIVAVLDSTPDSSGFAPALATRKPSITADGNNDIPGVFLHSTINEVVMAEWMTAATSFGPASEENQVGFMYCCDPTWAKVATQTPGTPKAIKVPNPSSFTVDDMVAAIKEAGAEDVPVVVVHNPYACDLAAPAYEALGKTPQFISPYWCVHDGWTIVGDRVDFSNPDLTSGEAALVDAMKRFAPEHQDDMVEASGTWLWGAADLLVLARITNDVGVDVNAIDSAIHSYRGPALLGSGDVDCTMDVPFPTDVCQTVVEVSRDAGATTQHLPPISLPIRP